jgi:cytokinin dehydrogenase
MRVGLLNFSKGARNMISRRQFLSGLAAGSVVVGFAPAQRRWVSAADACSSPFDRLPSLDGVILTDQASRAAAAGDAGNIISRTPVAVLQPGSVADIVKMVRFCRDYRIKVATRGQGHTTFGQSQVQGGLVIETGTLATIHSVGPGGADVDAGVKWSDLVTASVAQGLSPPVLTDFLGLSVGGTLSVGGVGSSLRSGVQVDHARELEVVTGEGVLRTCSRCENRDLFEAVLAGLGQCGIIVRAKVDLVPVKPQVRQYVLQYADVGTFFADLRELIHRRELDAVWGQLSPNPSGGWLYLLNATEFYDPSQPPDDHFLLRGLHDAQASRATQDQPYLNFRLRVDFLVEFLRSIGLWEGVVRPWYDVLLPNRAVEAYVGEVVPTLTHEDVGLAGQVLLFPIQRSTLTRPFFRAPDDEWVFLFDILTSADIPGPNPDFAGRMLQRNRTLFEKARRVGGTRYPIGALTFNRGDWRRQYGNEWDNLVCLKRRFDPDTILTPGPGIF